MSDFILYKMLWYIFNKTIEVHLCIGHIEGMYIGPISGNKVLFLHGHIHIKKTCLIINNVNSS